MFVVCDAFAGPDLVIKHNYLILCLQMHVTSFSICGIRFAYFQIKKIVGTELECSIFTIAKH